MAAHSVGKAVDLSMAVSHRTDAMQSAINGCSAVHEWLWCFPCTSMAKIITHVASDLAAVVRLTQVVKATTHFEHFVACNARHSNVRCKQVKPVCRSLSVLHDMSHAKAQSWVQEAMQL